MLRDATTLRRVGLRLVPVAMLATLLLTAPHQPSAAEDGSAGVAKMVRATWQEPDAAHTIEPHGTITIIKYPNHIVTNLPPPKDLTGDLTMTILVEVDTSTGTKVPFKFSQRSGILTITPSAEDVKDDVIQPSAIDGTTAKVRINVTAHGPRLNFLKKMYYEQINVWLPGQKGKQQQMAWTWKPDGTHHL